MLAVRQNDTIGKQLDKWMKQIRQYFENVIEQRIIDKEWTFFVSELSRQEFPKKHIPLKYIASYIGVTPQALSRIRKRIY